MDRHPWSSSPWSSQLFCVCGTPGWVSARWILGMTRMYNYTHTTQSRSNEDWDYISDGWPSNAVCGGGAQWLSTHYSTRIDLACADRMQYDWVRMVVKHKSTLGGVMKRNFSKSKSTPPRLACAISWLFSSCWPSD